MDKFESAKKIYFNNFASTYFMDRNGELKAYKKAKVPIELENVWKEEIMKNILADIKSGTQERAVPQSVPSSRRRGLISQQRDAIGQVFIAEENLAPELLGGTQVPIPWQGGRAWDKQIGSR